MVARLLHGQPVFPRPPAPFGEQTQNPDTRPPGGSLEDENKPFNQRDIYERFLSGEMLSDDEDEDYSPPSGSISQHDDDDDDDDDDAGVDTSEGVPDTLALYNDLSSATTSSVTAPVLLAHMTHESSSPLTRRRYRSLVSGQQDPDQRTWEEVNGNGERANRRDPPSNEPRRNCVICTAEERQIICWPCRCLALCDDCRQNLASRHSASKHTCPCCRQPVEGFSRIYIP